MSTWDTSEARVNAAVFSRFGLTCTYVPKAGEVFDLRYIPHDPAIDQSSVGTGRYFTDIEVIPGDLPSAAGRGDEVEISGVRYAVNKVLAREGRNLMLALYRKADLP